MIMQFNLNIKSDCEDNGPDMVAAVLDHVKALVEGWYTSGPVLDRNGNVVGSWDFDFVEPAERTGE
jgi:hypothetical protein